MSNEQPIIIKKIKKGGGDGHHGGAWKVAYADFVTAMMAFFMLMWLLNATTEQQRKGIADYFSPTIPINRISGGGDGAFGGDNIFSDESLAQNGIGGAREIPGQNTADILSDAAAADQAAAEVAALEAIEQVLMGKGGESVVSDLALRHVLTRLTDEGLIIEIFALPGAPLFEPDSTTPTPVTEELARMFARVFTIVENDIAITGFTRSRPVVQSENPVWDLSVGRAQRIRLIMEDANFVPERVLRVTGYADRRPAARDPLAIRNDRIEIVLLRSDQ